VIRESRITNNFGEKMKKHSGMRPQDIVILLKIASIEENWLAKELSVGLKISASEISESLNRSAIAGLISMDKKLLMKKALLEFIEFGLKYVFPQKPGAITRGIPTANSAEPLRQLLHTDEIFVWPYSKGELRGQTIEPLYSTVPEISFKDNILYELLALTDAIRIGKVREQKIAINEIRKRIG
jgi:predicted transcriptional regulator